MRFERPDDEDAARKVAVTEMAAADVRWKRRSPMPESPPVKLDLERVTCVAAATLSPGGEPLEVAVSECLEVFHEPTREALMQWRAWPTGLEGPGVVRVKVSFVIRGALRTRRYG